jgi:hypothetical protein
MYEYEMADQFQKVQYCRWTITMAPENCVFTSDHKVWLIEKLNKKSISEVFILAKQYRNYQNLF